MDLYTVTTLLVLGLTAAVSQPLNDNGSSQCRRREPPRFSFPITVGEINSTSRIAPTGLAHSRRFRYVLYFVNDRTPGGTTVFAVNAITAKIIGSTTITDAINLAWQDLTVGRCPSGIRGSCIYVQDAGLSGPNRADIIYVIREPRNPESYSSTKADLIINYTFTPGTFILRSNGLFVDCKGNIFFFGVLLGGLGARLHQIKNIGGNYTAFALFQIDLPTSTAGPVALSLSRDCCELLIKMPDIVYYVPIINDHLQFKRLQSLPYKPNTEEESVAWDLSQNRYYTVSESKPHILKVAIRNRRVPETRFSLGSSVGIVDDSQLNNLVALASSRTYPGFIYAASGNGLNSILIVQTFQAQSVGSIQLGLVDAFARDMATGRCPPSVDAVNCIFVSTVNLTTGNGTIFVFEEPENVFAGTEQIIDASNELTVTLPNGGVPWSIFVGSNGQIYVMNNANDIVTVFQLHLGAGKTSAVSIGQFTSPSISPGPVAADISHCNNEIIVKFRDVVLLFDVKRNDVAGAFKREPSFLPYFPERDGQSVAFSGCDTYLTASRENKPAVLLVYRKISRDRSVFRS